jgi:flagellar motility protein MotE (MotC chaperone)
MTDAGRSKSRMKPPNIFTLLMVIAAVTLAFRAANFGRDNSADRTPIISDAAAVEEKQAAAENMLKEAPKEASAAPEAPPPVNAAPTQDDEPRAFSSAEIEVLQSLAKRRETLDQRERQLSEREAVLTAAEQEVDKKITELKNMQSELKTLLGQQEKMEEDRIVSLVRIYEGMKPKEAATIFNTLDMDILITVIGRMSERKSAPILASMDPEKARTETTRLAMQRRLPELDNKEKTTP